MKSKLFALAVAATMMSAAGMAHAQTTTTPMQTQDGGSEATPAGTEKGTPMLPGERIDTFYTDSTRTTMKPDADLGTWWKGLTVQDQEAYKAGCKEEWLSTQRDLPESYLNVCKKVSGMM